MTEKKYLLNVITIKSRFKQLVMPERFCRASREKHGFPPEACGNDIVNSPPGAAGFGLGFRFPRGRHANAINDNLYCVNSNKLIGT